VRALALFGVAVALVLTTPSVAALPPSLVGTEWTHLPTARKVVALTFDACGNAAGARSILAALRARRAPATFFLCGRWVRAFPKRARAIAERYPVGNHTDTHPFLTTLSDEAVRHEVRAAAATIRTVARRDPRPLFRFPYGDRDARTIGIINSLGYGAIGWTVDTLGWQGRGAERTARSIRQRVLAALRPGAIVLMHAGAAQDGSTLDAEALPGVIQAVRARGYELVTVREFLSARSMAARSARSMAARSARSLTPRSIRRSIANPTGSTNVGPNRGRVAGSSELAAR
jgi:peptidoglycan/xylan/chitin deacetylase (PgdA/CDA1 family)